MVPFPLLRGSSGRRLPPRPRSASYLFVFFPTFSSLIFFNALLLFMSNDLVMRRCDRFERRVVRLVVHALTYLLPTQSPEKNQKAELHNNNNNETPLEKKKGNQQ